MPEQIDSTMTTPPSREAVTSSHDEMTRKMREDTDRARGALVPKHETKLTLEQRLSAIEEQYQNVLNYLSAHPSPGDVDARFKSLENRIAALESKAPPSNDKPKSSVSS